MKCVVNSTFAQIPSIDFWNFIAFLRAIQILYRWKFCEQNLLSPRAGFQVFLCSKHRKMRKIIPLMPMLPYFHHHDDDIAMVVRSAAIH